MAWGESIDIINLQNIILMRDMGIIIASGVAILLFIIGVCYLIWGDTSTEDSLKPLLVILPTMGAVLGYLIYKTSKK